MLRKEESAAQTENGEHLAKQQDGRKGSFDG